MKTLLRTLKKSISLCLTVLLLLSTWVFVAPEKANAATAGNYTISIDAISVNDGDCEGMEVLVYYKPNNGTGTQMSTTIYSRSDNFTFDGTGNDDRSNVSIAGFPTKVEYKLNKHSGLYSLGTLEGYCDISICGISMGSTDRVSSESAGWLTMTWEASSSQYPKVNSITSNPTASITSVRCSGSTTFSYGYLKDQYGVNWYQDPSVSYSIPSGATRSGNTVTFPDTMTVSGTATCTVSGGDKSWTASCSYTKHSYSGAYANQSAGKHYRKCANCNTYGIGSTKNATENCTPADSRYETDVNWHWSICSICGGYITKEGHSWDYANAVYGLDEAERETATLSCTICERTETVLMPNLPHSWNVGVITTPATCETDGVMTYTCLHCGETITEAIPYRGHQWDNGRVTTQATYNGAGVRTFTCSVCGLTRTEEFMKDCKYYVKVGTWGHTTDTSVFGATLSYTKLNGQKSTVNLPLTNDKAWHYQNYELDGYPSEIYATTRGNITDVGEVDVRIYVYSDSNYSQNQINLVDYFKVTCSRFGGGTVEARYDIVTNTTTQISSAGTVYTPDVNNFSVTAVKFGHTFQSGEVLSEPTCSQTGQTKYTCRNCGEIFIDKTAKLPHNWNGGEVTKQSTCVENGVRTYTCNNCGATKTEALPKTTHSWLDVPAGSTQGAFDLFATKLCANCNQGIFTVFNSGLTSDTTSYSSSNYDETTVNNSGYDLYSSYSAHPNTRLGLSFSAMAAIENDVTVSIYAYDTDESSGEVDGIYLVDETSGTETRVGQLSGANGTWHTTEIRVPAASFIQGHSYHFLLKEEVSGWVVMVRSVMVQADAESHNYTSEVTKEATCSEEGEIVYTCTDPDCGKVLVATIPVLPHTYDSGVVTMEASCASKGETTYTCQICGATKIDRSPRLAHSGNTIAGDGVLGSLQILQCNTCGENFYVAFNSGSSGEPGGSDIEVSGSLGTTKAIGSSFSVNETIANDMTVEMLVYTTSANTGYIKLVDETSNTTVTLDSIDITKDEWIVINATLAALQLETGHTYHLAFSNLSSFVRKTSYVRSAVISQSQTEAHTWDSGVVTKDATCTATGTRKFTCSDCGKTATKVIPALGHNYTSTVTTTATCQREGVRTYTCSRCSSSYTESIAKTSHNYVAGDIIKDSTCTETGTRNATCSYCGATTTQTIAKKSHTFEAREIINEPTCTEYGTQRYVCSVCGTEQIKDVSPLGHVFRDAAADGVYYFSGADAKVCSRCGNFYHAIFDSGRANGSKWSAYDGSYSGLLLRAKRNFNNTTFNNGGYDLFASYDYIPSTRLGLSFTVNSALPASVRVYATVNAYGNTNGDDPVVYLVDAGTGAKTRLTSISTERKWQTYKIEVNTSLLTVDHSYYLEIEKTASGSSFFLYYPQVAVRSVYLLVDDPEGHKWNKGEVTTEATCETDGVITYSCSHCGLTQTKTIPAYGHDFVTSVIAEATCTSPGLIRTVCSRCGSTTETETVVDHHYELTSQTAPQCGVSDGQMVYTCSLCGDTYTQILPNNDAHSYVVTGNQHATTTQAGYVQYQCSICGDTYTETIPQLGENRYILVLGDRVPWGKGSESTVLNKLVEDQYITGWNVSTTTEFENLDITGYSIIFIPNDQTTATYNKLLSMNDKLEEFASNGGVLIYGACDRGWAGGYINGALPGGVTMTVNSSYNAYILDGSHKIVTGVLTDMKPITNELLVSNTIIHEVFNENTLPENSHTILVDSKSRPALVEFPMGNGHVILSSFDWEWAYVVNYVSQKLGRTVSTYSQNAFDDLFVYGLTANAAEHTEHTYALSETTEPTCTESGLNTYACTVCGDSYTVEIPALGHAWGAWQNGSDSETHIRVCTRDASHVDSAAHCWDEGVVTAPSTCTEHGSALYTCMVCQATKTEEMDFDSSNHADYGTLLRGATEPTCTEDGYTGDTICAGCGRAITYGESIPMLDHIWGSWMDSGDGYHVRICERNAEHTQADAHSFPATGTVTRAATCTEQGELTYVCEDCGAENIETIPLDSNNHGDHGTYISEQKSETCEEDGFTGNTICDGCGALIIAGEVIPATGHDWASATYIWSGDNSSVTATRTCNNGGHDPITETVTTTYGVITSPTCSETGTGVYTAMLENALFSTQTKEVVLEKDAENHANYGTHIENAVTSTCTETGYSGDTVCNGCGAVLAEGETISATGHNWGVTVYTWSADNATATATRTCNNNPEEVVTETAFTERTVVAEATCSQQGEILYTATFENELLESTEKTVILPVDENNHVHTHLENAESANCDNAGYTGDTVCDDCGQTLSVGEVIPATGHNWTAVTYIWSADGTTLTAQVRCENDGDVVTEQVSADYELIRAATCKETGLALYTASFENSLFTTQTKEIELPKDATNHAGYGTHLKNAVDATCTNEGYTGDIVCDGCEAVLTAGSVTPKTPHIFGVWYVVTSASYTADGLEERQCLNCDAKETQPIQKLERETFIATFVADGTVVSTVEYQKGATSIKEPDVPARERFTGKWESYTLQDEDITIHAEYNPILSDDASDIETESSAVKNEKDDVLFKVKAISEGKVVKSTVAQSIPLDIVLVVDQSGSMDETLGGSVKKVDALKNSANAFIASVAENAALTGAAHRIAIVGFGLKGSYEGYENNENTELLTGNRGVVNYSDRKDSDFASALRPVLNGAIVNEELTAAVAAIDANGATAADLGLDMAKDIFANTDSSGRERVVIFMTDGEPTYTNGFMISVANSAVYNAGLLKNTYNALVYSVGIFEKSKSQDYYVKNFMNAVSSNYPNASSYNVLGKNASNAFYITADHTDNLNDVFRTITTESLTHTAPFDNVTLIKTLSPFVTLTFPQEEALRNALKQKYNISDENITVTRDAQGRTQIRADGLTPYEVIGEDGKTYYEVTMEFYASLNEKAAAAGNYVVDTNDSGIMLGADAIGYEALFGTNELTLSEQKTRYIFTINGQLYEIAEGSTVSEAVPETDFPADWTFSGWNTEGVIDANGTIIDATLVKAPRTVIWHTADGDTTQVYTQGESLNPPSVSDRADGSKFLGWNKALPSVMPDEDLEFTAQYGPHIHRYASELTIKATCTTDGLMTFTCNCGDTYTETVEAIGHNYEAMPSAEDNAPGKCTFVCANCGNKYEYALNYKVEKSTFFGTTKLFEFSLTDDDVQTGVQPDGSVDIRIPLNEYQYAAYGATVKRCVNGAWEVVPAKIEGGFLVITADHFTPYEVKFLFSCSETGNHTWDEGKETKPATCTEEGEMTYTCKICEDTETQPISKKNHTPGKWIVDKAATCKEAGNKHQECEVCHNTIATDTIAVDETNHADYGTHLEGKVEATCVLDGYTGNTVCNGCGKTLKNGQAIAKETAAHSLTHVDAKAATTEAEGNVEYYHCSVCGKNFSDQSGKAELTKVTTDKLPKQEEPTTQKQDDSGSKSKGDCKYCGETHSGPFGWLIKIIHSILAMFGMRK